MKNNVEVDYAKTVCPKCGCEYIHFDTNAIGGGMFVNVQPSSKVLGLKGDETILNFYCENGCHFSLVMAEHNGEMYTQYVGRGTTYHNITKDKVNIV